MKRVIVAISSCIFLFYSLCANEINIQKIKSDSDPDFQDTELRATLDNNTLNITSANHFFFEITIKGCTTTLYREGNASIDVSSYPRGSRFYLVTDNGIYTGIIE